MTGDEVKKETMCGAQYSDIEVAHKVRMLMRDQFDHEAICTMGRDRIMYLSQRVEKLEKMLADRLDIIRCGIGGNYSGDPKENPIYTSVVELLDS